MDIEHVKTGSSSARSDDREGSRRVLIADDNNDAAESLAMLLRLDGHDVAIANDGEAALQMFERAKPDAALLDIGMPHVDGYELARRIRARSDGAQVLLVAITGWCQQEDIERSRAAGFDYHLTKPVEPDAVAKLLRSAGAS